MSNQKPGQDLRGAISGVVPPPPVPFISDLNFLEVLTARRHYERRATGYSTIRRGGQELRVETGVILHVQEEPLILTVRDNTRGESAFWVDYSRILAGRSAAVFLVLGARGGSCRLIRIQWPGQGGRRLQALAFWTGRRISRLVYSQEGDRLSQENVADLERALGKAPRTFWETVGRWG